MSKIIRQMSWISVIALFVIAASGLSSNASTDSVAATSAEVPGMATSPVSAGDVEASDELLPQATCASIKCPPGTICINALECTPAGDCFHVGRCVSLP